MNLLLFPTSGKIYIDGREITAEDLSEDELYEVRRKVGMVFQNPDNHLVATVVEEDIAFGPENLGIPPKEIRRRVDAAMELLGITEYARHAPSKLSGGPKAAGRYCRDHRHGAGMHRFRRGNLYA